MSNNPRLIHQQHGTKILYGFRLNNSVFACMADTIEEAIKRKNQWIKERIAEGLL